MKTSNDQKVWKRVRIKTGERLSLGNNYVLYIKCEQTRVVEDDPYSDCIM